MTARVTAVAPSCTNKPRVGTRLLSPSRVSPNRKCTISARLSTLLRVSSYLACASAGICSRRKQDCQRAGALDLTNHIFLKRATAEQDNSFLDTCLCQRVELRMLQQLLHREVDTSFLQCTTVPRCRARVFSMRCAARRERDSASVRKIPTRHGTTSACPRLFPILRVHAGETLCSMGTQLFNNVLFFSTLIPSTYIGL